MKYKANPHLRGLLNTFPGSLLMFCLPVVLQLFKTDPIADGDAAGVTETARRAGLDDISGVDLAIKIVRLTRFHVHTSHQADHATITGG